MLNIRDIVHHGLHHILEYPVFTEYRMADGRIIHIAMIKMSFRGWPCSHAPLELHKINSVNSFQVITR